MSKIAAVLVAAVAGVFAFPVLRAQSPATNAAPTHPSSTNAAAAAPPVAIPTADIVSQALAVTTKLQAELAAMNPDAVVRTTDDLLPDLRRRIDDRLENDKRSAESSRALADLQNSQAAWQALAASLDESQATLTDRVRQQDDALWSLGRMDQEWEASQKNAKGLPAETLQRIQQVLDLIAATRKTVQADLMKLYSLQNQIAEQAGQVKSGLDEVNAAVAISQAQVFERTQPMLWQAAALTGNGGGAGREKLSLREQATQVVAYLQGRLGTLLIHALIFVLLIAAFFWIRNVTRAQAKKDETMRDAERIFGVPISTALVLSLLASNWLYPPSEAPRLLWAFIGAVALTPAVVITRRLITPALMPLLYATVVAYLIDQIRFAATPAGVFSRLVLLAELSGACIFILAALRSRKMCPPAPDAATAARIARVYLHFAYFIFLAAGVANVLGYVTFSFRVGDGMFESSYLAVVLYAAVRILDAVALAAMSLRPLNRIGMVRHHHDLVYGKVVIIVRWLAMALWVGAALNCFSIYNPVTAEVAAILDTKLRWGSLDPKVSAILALPVTVWAAFALSRFIRFALEEDVFPNFNLPRGIPYAVSTMVHYAVLTIGIFLAASAVGINLSSLTFLAGAFAVGLGFGLQNIMNNFMSGLILLFERPVKVGDTVQIDATTIGRVERIGIRASVILLTNGSELIMPNGNLISNPVTNWTLSNCERLIEVPVNIAPKTDTARALDALVDAAKGHAAVLKNPPPQAVVAGLAAAATSLKLRCWTDSEEDWMKLTSDLTLAVQVALERQSIALA